MNDRLKIVRKPTKKLNEFFIASLEFHLENTILPESTKKRRRNVFKKFFCPCT